MNLKKLITAPAIFYLCIFFTGCYSDIYLQLQKAETIIQIQPDSAFRILQHLTLPEKAGDSDQALFYLLLTAAADKNYQPYHSERQLSIP